MEYAYLNTTKKAILGFMAFFNAVEVSSYNDNGEPTSTQIVPIIFGAREKAFDRLNNFMEYNGGDLNTTTVIVQTILPIMVIRNLSPAYDSTRQLNKNATMKIMKNKTEQAIQKVPVAYNLSFDLYVKTKTFDDLMQIIEQVIPYFSPSINLNIKVIDGYTYNESFKYTLNSVAPILPEEKTLTEQAFFEATLTFTIAMHYYRLPKKPTVIKNINIEVTEEVI